MFLGLFFIWGLLGCAGLGEGTLAKPKVDIESVDVKNLATSGATVVFDVKVDIPNPFALKVGGLSYDLEVGGRPFTKGQLDSGAEVGAKAAAIIPVPIALNYTDIFASMSAFLKNRTAPYKMTGAAQVGILSIPFEGTGKLEFTE